MTDTITQNAARPATDADGNPVRDPTTNVLDLVNAAIRRQDDLRQAESDHVREMMNLHEKHAEQLRSKETERLDAIRAASDASVQRAAQVQQEQATALATQVVATADAFAARLVAALEPQSAAIADLRKTQYEQAGQKAQTIESGTGGRAWVGIVIGVGGLLIAGAGAVSAGFLGAAAIVVTLLLR